MKSKGDRDRTLRKVPSKARIQELINEATVDCYTEDEARMSIAIAVQEGVTVPFESTVFGLPVTVTGIDVAEDESLIALCALGKHQVWVPILRLPLPSPPPAGSEWIEAYRAFYRGGL